MIQACPRCQNVPMRASLPVAFLLSALLSGCAFKGEIPPSTHILQSGPFKVDPALLGQPSAARPVPPTTAAIVAPPPVTTSPVSDAPIKLDAIGLRTQRSVYFDVNKANIKADYEPALRAHARYLAEHRQARVRIEGNADERGTTEHNQRLGLNRAKNVQSTLLAHGATKQQVSIKTLGASNPRKLGHDEESWAENRRSDVVYEREE
ncbi:peptidoglycan-associated lipoprotein [Dechloromonas sp. HYN0024]|nr:peptidoglycan-associated lipoprotein [Dechloromonas sp. HYN0024]